MANINQFYEILIQKLITFEYASFCGMERFLLLKFFVEKVFNILIFWEALLMSYTQWEFL